MLRYYLKLGYLSIRANPALSLLMIAAIAIGIGACMTIVTVRPSGNAPELRCYVEAKTDEKAQALLAEMLERLRAAVGAGV